MINIWKYANAPSKATIIDVLGKEYTGTIIGVYSADEFDELEDCLALEIDKSKIIQFLQSEISAVIVS